MEVEAMASAVQSGLNESKQEKSKEDVALAFEKIFARKLVKEMTKDSFEMGDKNSVMGSSNKYYRKYIIDTMANELAAQRKLGMADMVSSYLSNSQNVGS